MFRSTFIVPALLVTLALGARTDLTVGHAASQARAAIGCASSQLAIRPALGSGSAGHYGEMYRIHNRSNTRCTLVGFPGAALLDARFNTLPTRVIRSTTLLGFHPVRLVNLRPGGNAYFVFYWADIPTGNEACRAARYLMIIAPNDRLPIVTYAVNGGRPITPCGGRLTTTPVEPTPFVM